MCTHRGKIGLLFTDIFQKQINVSHKNSSKTIPVQYRNVEGSRSITKAQTS